MVGGLHAAMRHRSRSLNCPQSPSHEGTCNATALSQLLPRGRPLLGISILRRGRRGRRRGRRRRLLRLRVGALANSRSHAAHTASLSDAWYPWRRRKVRESRAPGVPIIELIPERWIWVGAIAHVAKEGATV